jgi:hypothetical protein
VKDALKPGEDPFEANAFNQTASDVIDYDRQLPDVRHEQFSLKSWP